MQTTTRRAILAGAASLPALTIPSIAAQAGTDPIFAAIERHKTTYAEFERVCHEGNKLVDTIPAKHRRRYYVGDRDNAEMIANDDPAWTKYQDAWFVVGDAADDRAFDLLNIAPTSTAGIAALLDYVAAFEKTGGELFMEVTDDDGDNPIDGRLALMQRCAECLRKIEAAAAGA